MSKQKEQERQERQERQQKPLREKRREEHYLMPCRPGCVHAGEKVGAVKKAKRGQQ